MLSFFYPWLFTIAITAGQYGEYISSVWIHSETSGEHQKRIFERCVSGVCQCSQNTVVYNPIIGCAETLVVPVLLASSNLLSSRFIPQALPGAPCEPGVECTGGSMCSLGVCVCPPELVHEGSVCVSRTLYSMPPTLAIPALAVPPAPVQVALGATCYTATNICGPGAVCSTGVCQCSPSYKPVADYSLSTTTIASNAIILAEITRHPDRVETTGNAFTNRPTSATLTDNDVDTFSLIDEITKVIDVCASIPAERISCPKTNDDAARPITCVVDVMCRRKSMVPPIHSPSPALPDVMTFGDTQIT
uniref:EB domain-containing protein n=1 Tax=Angiostrongylus cantonensis TaxID=6313 RepID=A0A158P7B0_ANGCA